jgi:L-fuculose-phosphate aldolase
MAAPAARLKLRRSLLAAAQKMLSLGLVAGTSGNLSVRVGSGLYLITPTSAPYDTMRPADLVVINDDAEPIDGDGVPSSESLLHLAIYRARADVSAVCHTHSVHASAAAAAGISIPPILDEVVVKLGGGIECAAYGPPGSELLAANATSALGDRGAVLMRNHGVAGVGSSPAEALEACEVVERVAHIYFLARLANGAKPLPGDVIESERAVYRMRRGL